LKSDNFVLADAKALDQILFNLVDNAVKYTPESGHVVVRAYLADNRACIEICDDGYGIESKHRGKIFERFYRVDAGRSREMGGTGLGLSMVKNLEEVMNGQAGPWWPSCFGFLGVSADEQEHKRLREHTG